MTLWKTLLILCAMTFLISLVILGLGFKRTVHVIPYHISCADSVITVCYDHITEDNYDFMISDSISIGVCREQRVLHLDTSGQVLSDICVAEDLEHHGFFHAAGRTYVNFDFGGYGSPFYAYVIDSQGCIKVNAAFRLLHQPQIILRYNVDSDMAYRTIDFLDPPTGTVLLTCPVNRERHALIAYDPARREQLYFTYRDSIVFHTYRPDNDVSVRVTQIPSLPKGNLAVLRRDGLLTFIATRKAPSQIEVFDNDKMIYGGEIPDAVLSAAPMTDGFCFVVRDADGKGFKVHRFDNSARRVTRLF